MSAGYKYYIEPEPSIEERYDVSTGVRRRGPYKLDTTNLVVGSFLPSFTPIAADLVKKTAQVAIRVEVYEKFTTGSNTTLKIKKNSLAYVAPQLLVAGAYSFIGEIKGVVFELRWMLAFIVVMIVADFVLGIIDSVVKRGEDFRFSRAGRRTVCKFIEYNSYLVVGFMLGISILQPIGICSYTISAMCGLGLAFIFEFDSIADHICDIHGIKNKVSIKRLLVGYIKKKYNAAGEIIEEVTKEEEKK